MYLVKTRDGQYYELFEIKEGGWLIRNEKGEKKKVVSIGENLELKKGVPVFVEHKEKVVNTQAIVDIYKKM
jgi:hypothetical protein